MDSQGARRSYFHFCICPMVCKHQLQHWYSGMQSYICFKNIWTLRCAMKCLLNQLYYFKVYKEGDCELLSCPWCLAPKYTNFKSVNEFKLHNYLFLSIWHEELLNILFYNIQHQMWYVITCPLQMLCKPVCKGKEKLVWYWKNFSLHDSVSNVMYKQIHIEKHNLS